MGMTPLIPDGMSRSLLDDRILGKDVMLSLSTLPFVGVSVVPVGFLGSSSSELIEPAYCTLVMGVLPPDGNEFVDPSPLEFSSSSLPLPSRPGINSGSSRYLPSSTSPTLLSEPYFSAGASKTWYPQLHRTSCPSCWKISRYRIPRAATSSSLSPGILSQ